ncbi:MAG: flavodoxin-dependent (E)-4-hydroxy-3-methylbut-2-enyl-diphosphate synthase [Clostridiales bacterium]|nr:flavodoxin-dependent (E)-4-hydroxy-3-methylbut-2-enyl-diphosphate synthase [Clostridiales bacterium]
MTFMSKVVRIGNLEIGGGNKIAIQSMSTKRLCNVKDSILAGVELERAGCEIIRYSVLDEADAVAIAEVKKGFNMPLVADIHFDYRLAIKSIESGADKIRINPGNIGGEENVRRVAEVLKEYNIPCRVGSNTGSIEKEFLSKYGRSEVSLGESALKNVRLLEKYGVENIVISVKASDVPLTIKAYEYISKKTDYPLHLGVTEAGTEYNGVVKNAMAMGSLLSRGIGDTIRVSLSADPVKEVKAAKSILKGLNLISEGVEVVACPTCGRCEWDCMNFASEVEDYVKDVDKPLKIAVMGCVVNGPGEAKDADLGIAGAKDGCVIFKNGNIVRKIEKKEVKQEFFKEIDICLR